MIDLNTYNSKKDVEILDITLCRECHRNVHSNWGSKTNPI